MLINGNAAQARLVPYLEKNKTAKLTGSLVLRRDSTPGSFLHFAESGEVHPFLAA